MYKILNQDNDTVAYIQNMMILNKKREKVIFLIFNMLIKKSKLLKGNLDFFMI